MFFLGVPAYTGRFGDFLSDLSVRIPATSLLTTLLARLGLRNSDSQRLSAIPLAERLKVALAAFVALFIVTYTSLQLADTASTIVLLASMGASSVLLFGLPNSPLAKPWSFAAGHLISATVGLICSHLFTDLALMAAATVGLVLFVMYLFECMHPLGGATALVPVIASTDSLLGYEFLLYPVALNVFVMLAVALLLQKFWLKRGLQPPPQQFDPVHLHQDPSPLKRLGLQAEDLVMALNSFDTVVDISEQDLERLYQRAQLNAYQRFSGDIRCRDIMSQDLITVRADTPLFMAWQLLRKHKIGSLPVVDADQRLIGIIATVDILKQLQVPSYAALLKQVNALLLQRHYKQQQKLTVADRMSTQLVTVGPDEHLVTLVPLLSDKGLHHIPIIAADGTLLGLVTQSDVIAALFQHQLRQLQTI